MRKRQIHNSYSAQGRNLYSTAISAVATLLLNKIKNHLLLLCFKQLDVSFVQYLALHLPADPQKL